MSMIAFLLCNQVFGQTLSISDAIGNGVANYGIVKAKKNNFNAANEQVSSVKREYLPNLNLSAQQSYGTVNGQNGPMYGAGGLGVASSGLPLPEQNWNAAFGALYLVNVNWEFFSFGRTKQNIIAAKSKAAVYQKDYDQEIFQHKVKIAAAYLNLLASQRLLISQQKNLERSEVFFNNVSNRVKNGLLPGVDSTMATAEVSRAKLLINQFKEKVKIQNNELCQLMGEEPRELVLDTAFISRIPAQLIDYDTFENDNHPARLFLKSRIQQSVETEKVFRKEYMPSFSLFGVYQTRASGFSSDYAMDQNSLTHNYLDGINPTRQNYLIGIAASWNLTSIVRSSKKVSSQKYLTQALEEEYKVIDLELRSNNDSANTRLNLSLQNFNEAPLQVNAAQQAYTQRITLYNNGLNDLTDVTTAQFSLNRAETDRDIAFTNVWQALLMKAAATGDFNLFINAL